MGHLDNQSSQSQDFDHTVMEHLEHTHLLDPTTLGIIDTYVTSWGAEETLRWMLKYGHTAVIYTCHFDSHDERCIFEKE